PPHSLGTDDVHQVGPEEQESHEGFHQRIARGNGRPTIAALTAQRDPAQDGYIIAHTDRRVTRGTARAGPDHTLLPGNPIDAYVNEAAAHGSNKKNPQAQPHHGWPIYKHQSSPLAQPGASVPSCITATKSP